MKVAIVLGVLAAISIQCIQAELVESKSVVYRIRTEGKSVITDEYEPLTTEITPPLFAEDYEYSFDASSIAEDFNPKQYNPEQEAWLANNMDESEEALYSNSVEEDSEISNAEEAEEEEQEEE